MAGCEWRLLAVALGGLGWVGLVGACAYFVGVSHGADRPKEGEDDGE